MMKNKKFLTWLLATIAVSVMTVLSACEPASVPVIPTPGEDGLVSITVFKQPSKTAYYIGETFDPSGMVLKANYEDGSSVNLLYEDCDYNREPLTAADNEIVISFGSQSVTVAITVTDVPDDVVTVTGIELAKLPTYTQYTRGEVFNAAGMVVNLVYSDNSTMPLDLSNLTYSQEPLTLDDKSVVVSYEGYTLEIPITVSKYSLRIQSDEHKQYRLEAEKADLSTIEITESWAAGKSLVENNTAASGNAYLANLSAATGYVEYGIYSEVECKVTLDIYCALGKAGGTMNMDDAFEARWNGILMLTDATLVGTTWLEFHKVRLACVMLKKGDNVLRLTRKGTCPNFDCVDFDVNNPDDEYEALVTKIEVADMPQKTDYAAGDVFDPTGMTVTATLDDGTTETITAENLEFSKTPLTVNDTKVTVSYGGCVAEVAVTVKEPVLIGIKLVKEPRTQYVNGEKFDPTGMIVQAEYDITVRNVPIAELTYSKDVLTEAVTQITVGYGGFEITVNITVSKYSIKITSDENKTYRLEAEEADLSNFEITNDDVAKKGLVENNANASGGKQLCNLWAANGYVEYGIYSEVDAYVTIYIFVATGVDNIHSDTAFGIAWNGRSLLAGSAIPNLGWNTIQKIRLACVKLNKGDNVLRLTRKGTCPNFDCVDFEVNNPNDNPDANVTITETGTQWTVEAETCTVTGTPANDKTEFTEGDGTYLCCLGKSGNTVTVTIWSKAEKTVGVSMIACQKYGIALEYADTFDTTLNGETISLSGSIESAVDWKTFSPTELGNITLQQGMNTLVFTVKAAQVPNIDKFVFKAV